VLKEFSAKLPTSKEAMLEINGVGEVKFEKYGKIFLELCQAIKEEFPSNTEAKTPLKKLTKTYLHTYELLQEDKSIEEVANIRELGVTSILSHLQVLVEHEKITQKQKEHLLKPLEIPKHIQTWIEQGLAYETSKELRKYLYLYDYLSKESNEFKPY
jgi:ATP-dependent DNA helicase RecQ